MLCADYAKCSSNSNGLQELFEDCHVGILLKSNARTWSLMQLERASRESKKFEWRDGAKIRKQLQLRKEAYFEVLRRAEGIADDAPGMHYDEALQHALCTFSSEIDALPNTKTVSAWAERQLKVADRESVSAFEGRAFGWSSKFAKKK